MQQLRWTFGETFGARMDITLYKEIYSKFFEEVSVTELTYYYVTTVLFRHSTK